MNNVQNHHSMKKLSIFLFAIALSSLTFAQSKNYDLAAFTAISLSNSVDVELSQGSSQSVSASGSQSAIDKLNIRVEKGSLKIGSKKGTKWSKGDGNVTIKITAPEVNAIVISGSGDLKIMNDFKSSNFAVTVSGSGDLSCAGSVTANKLALVSSGSADVQLKGSSDKVAITNSGSSDLSLSNFKSKEGAIVNSGSGDIEVYVSEKVAVTNTGSGDINLGGSPDKKTIINTGSGDIDYK